jgi:hypothetical protein
LITSFAPHTRIVRVSRAPHQMAPINQSRVRLEGARRLEDPEIQADDTAISKGPLDRPLLAALDLMAIILFSSVGKASHSSDGSIDPLAVLWVALPFLISWFTITPFLGLYGDDATKSKTVAAIKAAKGWIIAVPIGCVLRGILKGYIPPVPFVIVTMIATLVIIGGTRVAYSAVNEKLSSSMQS